MRRSGRTPLLLLGAVGLAVSALSGCVTVSPARAPDREGQPGATAPPADGQGVRPQIAQAPVRETLATPRSAPSGASPAARESTRARTAAPAPPPRPLPAPATVPPAPRRYPPGRHGAGGTAHGSGRSGGSGGTPAVGTPPAGSAGVCALGRTYGHWPADSPQARICHDTYGH